MPSRAASRRCRSDDGSAIGASAPSEPNTSATSDSGAIFSSNARARPRATSNKVPEPIPVVPRMQTGGVVQNDDGALWSVRRRGQIGSDLGIGTREQQGQRRRGAGANHQQQDIPDPPPRRHVSLGPDQQFHRREAKGMRASPSDPMKHRRQKRGDKTQ